MSVRCGVQWVTAQPSWDVLLCSSKVAHLVAAQRLRKDYSWALTKHDGLHWSNNTALGAQQTV